MAVPREELEQGLHLLALLLFRNEVKVDTAQAIADLKQGQVCKIALVMTSAVEPSCCFCTELEAQHCTSHQDGHSWQCAVWPVCGQGL